MKNVINRTALLQAVVIVLIINLGTTTYQHFFGAPAEVATIGSEPAQLIVGKQSAGKSSRYIRVDTDKMSVLIDKLGGRVVKVSFADYSQAGDLTTFFGRDEDSYLDTQAGIVGDESLLFSSSSNQYRVNEGRAKVVLQATDKRGVRYSKEFSFAAGDYKIGLDARVQNGSQEEVSAGSYFVITGDKKSSLDKSPPRPADLSFDAGSGAMTGTTRGYSGVSYTTKSKPNVRVKFNEMDAKEPDVTRGGWVAFQKHHFIAAWVLDNNAYKVRNFWLEGKRAEDSDLFEQRFATQAASGRKALQPGESFSSASTLYVGPQDPKALALLDSSLRLTMDYGFFWMFASFLHKGLDLVHTVVPNWAMSLIILTLLSRLLFYKSTKEQAIQAQKLKVMQPEKDAIDKKFEGRGRLDPEKSEAMVKLYKKHDLKVLSLSTFMPILQIPLLFAFYGMVSVAVEFRSSPFLWMSDISAPDPYYILPALAVIAMYFQSREMAASEEFKMVARIMPIAFAFFAIKFPASLQIYIGLSTGLGALQNKLLVKHKSK